MCADERQRRIASTITTHRGVSLDRAESGECVGVRRVGPPRGAAPRLQRDMRQRGNWSEGTGAHRSPQSAARRADTARRRAPPTSGASQQYIPPTGSRTLGVLNQSLIASPTRGSDACATPLGPSVRLGVCGPAGKAAAAGSPATRSTLAAPGAEEATQPVRIASHRSGLLAGCCGPCGIRRPSVEPPGGPGADQNDRACANFRADRNRGRPLC